MGVILPTFLSVCRDSLYKTLCHHFRVVTDALLNALQISLKGAWRTWHYLVSVALIEIRMRDYGDSAAGWARSSNAALL